MKRIKLTHGTANVSTGITTVTKEALNKMSELSKALNADELIKSLGEASTDNEYEIAPYKGEWWITHKHVGSGEPLKQWLTGKP